MPLKELFSKSWNRHKTNRINSWILAFGCALICAASLLVCLLFKDTGMVFLIFPLFILPLLFSFTVIHFGLRYKAEISWRNVFKFFRGYYSPQFIGSYKVWKAFLKSILIHLLGIFILISIDYLILRYGHPDIYDEFISALKEIGKTLMDSDAEATIDLTNLFEIGDGLIYNMVVLTDGASCVISVTSFMYFVFYRSIGIYPKLFYKDLYFRFVDRIIDSTLRNNKSLYKKYFWALNWPIIVLMLLGGFGATFVCYSLYLDSYIINIVSECVSIFILIFFLPFYWSNMETISEEFEPLFRGTIIESAQSELKSYETYMNANLEKEAEEPADETTSEDTKKDSEES